VVCVCACVVLCVERCVGLHNVWCVCVVQSSISCGLCVSGAVHRSVWCVGRCVGLHNVWGVCVRGAVCVERCVGLHNVWCVCVCVVLCVEMFHIVLCNFSYYSRLKIL
jgi:hypothetical protein